LQGTRFMFKISYSSILENYGKELANPRG